ncbi:DEKNAAC100661 [Brettanomyces naardenensis]|uniref:Eukaryotic translation initiation factor 3 subunit E n=1 Tax=Brettanomyces naardenensis TaxID=13370 RepID=A0A448YFR6_BRENA|nr:DEKNAAC100661 [Brettanomyces naardenensis]
MSTEQQEFRLSEEQLEIARKYDLTEKFVQFLDRHLVYPLIENLEFSHDPLEVENWEYNLLKDTYMTKFIEEKWLDLHPGEPLPKEFEEKQTRINDELVSLNESTKKTLDILSSQEVQESLKQDKSYNRDYLAKNHGIDDAKIYELYRFGKFQYNRGDYVMASDLLNNFRLLSTNQELNFSATWGKLAAEIISFSWSEAMNELNKLREVIDNRNYEGSTLDQLNKRTWLIHYSLFIFFNGNFTASDAGIDMTNAEDAELNEAVAEETAISEEANDSNKDKNKNLSTMIDLFLSSSYKSTIQASCPWILRYVIVALLQTQQYKRLRDVVRAVDVETYEFQDPFTQLLETLFVSFEFDNLSSLVEQISVLIETDFFVSNLDGQQLIQNLQELIFNTVTKVYEGITVEYLSKLFNEDVSVVEKFLEKKKDKVTIEEDGTILVRRQAPASVYQQVYEKTKAFNFKANQILNTAFNRAEI